MCIRFILVSEMLGKILDRGRSFIVVILSLYISCSINFNQEFILQSRLKSCIMLTHYNWSQDANLKQHRCWFHDLLIKETVSIVCCIWTKNPYSDFHPQKQNFVQILCFVLGHWHFVCHTEVENHWTWRVF